MRYSPSPLVCTVRERLVSVFVTDTSALATAAPVASITWPYIVVEVICALTPTEEVMTSKQKSITTPSFLRIGFSYRCAGHLCASSYSVALRKRRGDSASPKPSYRIMRLRLILKLASKKTGSRRNFLLSANFLADRFSHQLHRRRSIPKVVGQFPGGLHDRLADFRDSFFCHSKRRSRNTQGRQ